MSDLPGAIHLVAQTPIFDGVRFGVPMRRAQVSVVRAFGRIAIFDEIGGLLNRACTQVDAEHRFCVNRLAKVYKLIRAKLVALDGLPGQFAPLWTLLARADTIFPAVAAQEIPTRIADRAEIQVP